MSPVLTTAPVGDSDLASDRQAGRQGVAAVRDRVGKLYEITRSAVAAAGGAEVLRVLLHERDSYIATISKGLNQKEERRVPIDWWAALLEDRGAANVLAAGVCEVAGFDAPVRHRAVSRAEVGEAALEVIGRAGVLRDLLLDEVARRLGVRVDDLPL